FAFGSWLRETRACCVKPEEKPAVQALLTLTAVSYESCSRRCVTSLTRFHSWFPLRDRVAEGWLLTGSPLSIALITATYVCFVTVGRAEMDVRSQGVRSETLRSPVQRVHHVLQRVFMCRFLKLGYWDSATPSSQDMDRSDSPASLEIKRLSWWLYLFKLSELSDTVFFVLRKNNRQISTLHVAHHVIVSWNMWLN
ncbi:elongation of very long chain fatty acids protein 7-like, partial [Rhipicephalus sanguineus]|uniref:elongation of very long chain fatty acids protein 7-like n=1 Tax=Rhipicephalus sanguineus TaxID=34632 RepID=UPI001894B266